MPKPTELNLLYEEIVRIRIAQIFFNERYKKGEFLIPIHLALGHEAISVALNAVLEKNGADVPGYLNVSPILCSNSKQNTFIWTCNINPMPNTNEDYPTYRIKLVSSDSNTVVAYSNYFKVSVDSK